MNRVFRIVRNRTTGKCTVASELAAARGKRGTLDRTVASALILAAPMLGAAAAAGAAPMAELTGSNGQMWHGSPCDTLTVPSTCANETRDSQADISGAALSFPYHHLLVGANLSNTNTGPAASGNLSITDGGVVNATRLYVGYEGNTSGTVNVSGEGSRWNGGGTMSVGNYGTGAMTISDGGYARGSNIYVGNFEGGAGDLKIDGISAGGMRSTLQANGTLFVGNNNDYLPDQPGVIAAGDGVVAVTDGGLISSNGGSIGGRSGTGTLTVRGVNTSGQASQWNMSGGLMVGVDGKGTLNVMDGAEVNNTTAYVGYYGDGDGTVNVGNGGVWTSSDALNVGFLADGEVNIGAGGTVRSASALLGGISNGNGAVKVSGAGALWKNDETLMAGQYSGSYGFVMIEDGAQVTSGDSVLGSENGGYGSVYVSDAGSRFDTSGLTIGNSGQGAVQILNGGSVQSAGGSLGQNFGSYGQVVVSDAGSRWDSSDAVTIGEAGSGALDVTNGGSVQIADAVTVGASGSGAMFVTDGGSVESAQGSIAELAGSYGQVYVGGEGAQWNNTDAVTVGIAGTAYLSVADGARVSASEVNLATEIGSEATLYIGEGALAGKLDTASVTGGDGIATVNFDHIDDIDFAPVLGGKLDVNKSNTGTTTLAAVNDYAGTTSVQAGTLKAGIAGGFSAASDHVVNTGAALAMNGFDQTIASLHNSGTVAFHDADTSAGTTLTIAGDYEGNDGMLLMNTVLGDDSSVTDKLVVEGSTRGNSFVQVRNAGGAGAATDNGIELIHVGGASDGVFQLQGRAVAGLYDYQLHQGGRNTPDDGNWYLRSEAPVIPPVDPIDPPVDPVDPPVDPVDPVTPPVDPIDPVNPPVDPFDPVTPPVDPITPPVQPEQPEVPTPVLRPEPAAYLGNQVAALRMFQNSMHDRVGEPGLGEREDGKGYTSWARVQSRKLDAGTVGGQIDISTDASVVQVGAEKQFAVGEGRIHAGVMGGYGRATTQGSSNVSDHHAKGEVKGRNVGIYGTWFQNADGPEGLYVDGVAEYGRFDNTVKGDYLGTEQYDSTVRSASLEAGYAFKVHEGERVGVYVEPQAQVIYSDFSSDDVREQNGTLVQSHTAGGTTTRLGARVYTRPLNKENNRVQPYAAVNWWSGGNDATIAMDGERLSRDLPNNIVEVKTGLQLELGKGWSGWGELSQQRGSYGFKDTGVQMGVKLSW